MLNFLFKKDESINISTPAKINEIYTKLKEIYKFNDIVQERKTYLKKMVEKHQYLPYPHIKALEELTPAEVLFALEIKFKNEKINLYYCCSIYFQHCLWHFWFEY